MLPAQYYQNIYLLIVTAIFLFHIQRYRTNLLQETSMPSKISSEVIVAVLFFAFFVGLRPVHIVFVDMVGYAFRFDYFSHIKPGYSWLVENKIFDNLFIYLSTNGWTKSLFFLLMSFVYFVGTFIVCKKMFKRHVLIAYLVWLGAFSTFSYGVNGIKAGVAATFFLLAIAYNKNVKISILFLLISLGFHHSMTLPLGAFSIAYFFRNTKVYFIAWAICLLMAFLHINFFSELLAGLTDDRGAEYLLGGSNWGGKSGFRIDFVIYSAMPVLVGYWALFRRCVKSFTYELLLSIYLITNAVWMLCMYANFTNRIAYLSWSLYPIVLIYPFFKEDFGPDRYHKFSVVAMFHLFFTLFMMFIYY